MALVQKVIRTHFPHAVYGTCSSCCKRLGNRSRKHRILFHFFCVLQLNSLVYWGKKKRKKVPFFVSWKLNIHSRFQKSCLITGVFFAALSKTEMTSIEVEGPQSLLTSAITEYILLLKGPILLGWSWHPKSLSFKLQWLNLAGTKNLGPWSLYFSMYSIRTMGWLPQGKWLPQGGTVKIHWVFKESLRIKIKYFSIFFTLWTVWKELFSYNFIYSRWHRFISFLIAQDIKRRSVLDSFNYGS